MPDLFDISVKGKKKSVPAWQVGDVIVLKQGKFLKTAAIFDEYWLEGDTLPNPEWVIAELQRKKDKPDIFTFAQRVPDVEPRFNYHFEWNNFAVVPLSTYEHWYNKQISSSTKRNIRASKKRGIIIRASEYNEEYIRGIMSIYNETPIRQRRRFWHYGKDFVTVQVENGTYSDRSTFLAAYYQGEMIGYLKIVWDKNSAAIMQILSKMEFYDKRPNNALLAEAVKQCCSRGIKHLLYEKLVYGKKEDNSLTAFKRSNGFIRMDVPQYFVPLTLKGLVALRLGLNKNQKERLPYWLSSRLIELRTKWYTFWEDKG